MGENREVRVREGDIIWEVFSVLGRVLRKDLLAGE